MTRRFNSMIGLVLLLVFIMSGCGGAKDGEEANGASETGKQEEAFTEPVTLKFFNYGASIVNQQDLEDYVIKPVQAKYPNIKFEQIKGMNLQQLITSGEVPDIISSSNYYLNDMLELGLLSDLNGFIKKEKVDLKRFEPGLFDALKPFGKNGEIYAMPYAMNYGVLVYNKDIFDRFGVPYPKDNMTLSQTIELAKRVTRNEQGTQYIGFDPSGPDVWTRAYSLPTVDEKQEKAVLTSDGYKKIFTLLREAYNIPGIVGPNKTYAYGFDYFIKDQKLAMFPFWLNNLTTYMSQLNAQGSAQGKTFNWDVVSEPSFEDKPGLGRVLDFHLLVVPPTSKNKEASYRVIQTMISDESQIAMNKKRGLTVLNKPELKKQYASDLHVYDGKNLAGIFKVKPAPLPVSTKYDRKIYSILGEALKSMITTNTDVNTAMRDANEKADKYIQEDKQQTSSHASK